MKSIMMPVIAGAIAAAALGLAGAANAAPSGPTTAAQTVSNLQAQGFQVILNKIGTAPLEQCVVSGPDLLADGFRGTGSDGRHRHDGHGEDRVRRPGVLIIRTADPLVPAVVRAVVPLGWQLLGFERVVDPGAVWAGAGPTFEDEQHLAHPIAVLAVGDLPPASALESTMCLVDRSMYPIAVANSCDTGGALARPIAADWFRCLAGGPSHVGEQVQSAW